MNIFERITQALTGTASPASPALPDDIQQAKQLFFEYDCRTFFMAHDGVYEDYRRYHITTEQEQEWRAEFIQRWTSQLGVDDLAPLRHLWHAAATEALPALLARAQSGDSYAQVCYAAAIWDITDTAPERYPSERSAAIVLWRALLRDPITITAAHRDEIAGLVKGKQTCEEYIRDHAKGGLVLKAKQRI